MANSSNGARAMGTGSYLTLRGKTWNLSPITARDFTEAQAFVKSKQPSVFAALSADPHFKLMPEAVQQAAVVEAMRQRAEDSNGMFSQSNLEAWLEGEGLLFLFWRHVRRNHPELQRGVDDILEMFCPKDDDRQLTMPEMSAMQEAMDEADGIDVEKKSLLNSGTASRRQEVKRRQKNKRQRMAKKAGRSTS